MILFGLTWFLLALGPTAQIMPHHISRADRFLYLPLVGLAISLGMILRPSATAAKRPGAGLAVGLVGALALLSLGALSARQVRIWRDSVTLWTHCLTVEPMNPYGHSALADNLVIRGQFDEAVGHYQTALRIAPDHADTLGDYAWALAACEDPRKRDFELALGLAERACRLTGWKEPRILRKYSVVHTNLGNELVARGRFERAADHYREAIAADPSFETPQFGLALLLTTCPDEQLRRPDEAVRHAERGCRLIEQPDAHRLTILAAAYAEAGKFDEAVNTIDRAIARAGTEGCSPEMTAELRRQRSRYRAGKRFDPLPE